MKFIDSKGRLFNTISIIDLGAAVVILMVIIGIFFFPGTSGSVAQGTGSSNVEMDVLVQGLRMSHPETLEEELEEEGSTQLIIRNQPHGEVEVKSFERIPRTVVAPQPDGSVIAEADPRLEEEYKTDWLITLAGDARVTNNGVVVGSNSVKIGTTVELEGFSYNFRGSVVDVRLPD
ncbi:DUF4330 domain-containing protein [Euhalothece natronophila Z-M001]|uniref:DUF4330 domain-containing protein n=1 Tax=Euhalothece natronophila Z-M001 TaxID=522448 RepID=A0A5B8NQP5_9CHRO|nr:DUF4330 domain-containing protein [Euhalothece natronophila]QDZ41346.1 DUF4330 domain-containing protein [Euhalothece natronophila Z-M001]